MEGKEEILSPDDGDEDEDEDPEVVKTEEEASDLYTEELRKERDRLIELNFRADERISKKYAEKFLSFLAYQNGKYDEIPEFLSLALLSKRLKDAKAEPDSIRSRIEKERARIYQEKIVSDMLKFERALDPDEAKRIRGKITQAFNDNLKIRGGDQPKLRNDSQS